MAYDGSIRINTQIDGKGFNTGVKSMMASLGSLAAAIGVAFSVQQMLQFGKTGVQTAMQMEAGWQGLRYMANAYGKDFRNHIKEFLNRYRRWLSANDERTASLQKYACPWLQHRPT